MFPDNFLFFIGLTTLVSLAPGANTMFVMSQAALKGRRAGIAAGLGIEVSNVFYFLLIAFGLSSLVAASEMIFDLLKWGGALYLAVLGVFAFAHSFKKEEPAPVAAIPAVRSSHGSFFDGLAIGMGNPKTIIWFLTLLPQFINKDRDVFAQTMTIAVVGTIIDLAVQWLYVYAGGHLSRFLSRPRIRAWFERGMGIVFMALALLVALSHRTDKPPQLPGGLSGPPASSEMSHGKTQTAHRRQELFLLVDAPLAGAALWRDRLRGSGA
jgi:homoserine/homoserine lactone efflux protein